MTTSGLPWVRFDTGFPTHDKVLDLLSRFGDKGKGAGFVYACSVLYSGGQGTDGLIQFSALPFVHGTKRDAAMLVEVDLWLPDPDGWQLRNWRARNPSCVRGAAEVRYVR